MVWLRAALIGAAHASSRARNTYLGAQYHRPITRRGKKKAVIAVGHTILTIAYHLLRDGAEYADLGLHYFDERDEEHVTRRLMAALALGGDGYFTAISRPVLEGSGRGSIRRRGRLTSSTWMPTESAWTSVVGCSRCFEIRVWPTLKLKDACSCPLEVRPLVRFCTWAQSRFATYT
jgi:hypothetical protein